MLLVDDLLITPFMGLLNTLRMTALEELYDIESIRDDIKENQLMYEIGERTEAEYESRKAELERELELAERVHEELEDRVQVKR